MPPIEDVTSNGLRARIARPERPGKAGILFLPHWPGIDDGSVAECKWLASEGFTVLAWDPFSAYSPDIDAAERRRLTRGPITDENARKEQSHWLGYMREELGLEHIGGIGFCMGGRMGLALGVVDPRLECYSAFYATLRMPVPEYALPVVDMAADIKCPVQVHYPGLDESTSYETFVALRSALEKRAGNPPTLAHYYPKAVHGFLGHDRQAEPDNAAATKLAKALTVAFFRGCLLP
jgi:carboxymethylenebutenolidase